MTSAGDGGQEDTRPDFTSLMTGHRPGVPTSRTNRRTRVARDRGTRKRGRGRGHPATPTVDRRGGWRRRGPFAAGPAPSRWDTVPGGAADTTRHVDARGAERRAARSPRPGAVRLGATWGHRAPPATRSRPRAQPVRRPARRFQPGVDRRRSAPVTLGLPLVLAPVLVVVDLRRPSRPQPAVRASRYASTIGPISAIASILAIMPPLSSNTVAISQSSIAPVRRTRARS
jgi:hypothetical protein